MAAKKAAAWNFLAGGGELGERIRARDWSQTAVGAPDQWPQSLRTTVGTCLNAQLPILIWWGPERVMLYNDACRLLLGDKHPQALGCPGRDVWPDIWDTLGPKLDGVGTRGQAGGAEKQVRLASRHGASPPAYSSYSLSPIYDESDGIGGVFGVGTETNDALLARQQRQELDRTDRTGPANRRTQPPVGPDARVLNAVIQRMPLGIGIFSGADNVVELVNPVVQAMWGRTTEHVLGKPLREVAPEMVEQGFDTLLAGVRQTGQPFTGNELSAVLNRNGQADRLYFDFVYEPLPEPDGRIERVLVVATEVTGVREARLLMEENANRLQLLFEQAPVAIAITGPGPDLVYELANPFYCELVGRPASQLVGKPLREAVSEEAGQILDGKSFGELLIRVMETGVAHVNREAQVDLVRNGQLETVFLDFVLQPRRERAGAGIPVRDNQPPPDDTITGVVVVVTDVTQAVRTRHRVESNERLLAAIIRQTPLGVGIFRGPDFIVELANPTVCQLWGRTREQVMEKPIFTALPEASGQGFEELLTGVYETGIPFEGHELPVTLERNGQMETVYFDLVYDALRNADGRIERTMVVATDVTRTRQVRRQIKASEASLRRLFEQAPVAIAIVRGPDFIVELANPEMCMVWHRTQAQLLEKPLFQVLTETAGQGFEELLTQVLQTGRPFVGHELPAQFLRNGKTQTVYVNFVYEPLHDDLPDGPVRRVLIVGTDVTEQVLVRQQTEQLLDRERALNELKSNFVTLASHEFRTPMGTILSSASLIGRYNGPTEGDKRQRHVARIQSAVHGLTGLLNDFLSLSQMEQTTLHGNPQPLSILLFCQEVIEDMQQVIKPRQRVLYTHESGESLVSLDGQMLKNILINLLVNASKYSAEGKDIALTTAVTDRQLRLTVRDEGIGIPDADKENLFINFFRARNASHVAGTGLGLYVVKRYVDLLSGSITFESQLDSGTTFTILLPLSPLP